MRWLLLIVSALVACEEPKPDPYVEEIDAWHGERLRELRAPDGWLSLAGLHWLDEGDNPVGAGTGATVRLPATAADEKVGVIRRAGSEVTMVAEPGVDLRVDGAPFAAGPLRTDREGAPTVLQHRNLLFFVIARGDRLGVRVKDPESEVRLLFRGVERYPVERSWRIEARFESHPPGRTVPITTVIGTQEEHPSPGVVVFERGGGEHRLEAVRYEGSAELFFVFGDQTNRDQTYGAGRFLYAALPEDGRVVLDFNRAYNPPCAFTPFATCPLPPKQNKLGIRVTAGEKRYRGGH